MWAILLIGAWLILGIAAARWWLAPAPLVAYTIYRGIHPLDPNDDVGAAVDWFIVPIYTVALAVGIYGGKLARQRGKAPPADEPPSN